MAKIYSDSNASSLEKQQFNLLSQLIQILKERICSPKEVFFFHLRVDHFLEELCHLRKQQKLSPLAKWQEI